MLSRRYEVVRHPKHEGRIGYVDKLLDVVHCDWCAVGYHEDLSPKESIQFHFERAHPNINPNMWKEYLDA